MLVVEQIMAQQFSKCEAMFHYLANDYSCVCTEPSNFSM